jgi:Flp pilus assembly protein TadD
VATETRPTAHALRDYAILLALCALAVTSYLLLSGRSESTANTGGDNQTGQATVAGLVAMGNGLMDRGMYDHAVTQYRRALGIDSLQPDVMVDLGACYHALGEYEEADAALRGALQQQPGHRVALFNLGVVRLSMADTAGTRRWWGEFLEVSGEGPQAEAVRKRLEEL